jgi:hypothetical protein
MKNTDSTSITFNAAHGRHHHRGRQHFFFSGTASLKSDYTKAAPWLYSTGRRVQLRQLVLNVLGDEVTGQ